MSWPIVAEKSGQKMHMQAHLSGQISGQVSNQVAPQLPGLPHQNYSSLPAQIQSFGAIRGTVSMDPDLLAARTYIRNKLYQKFIQRHPQKEMHPRIKESVKRLEDRLFRFASSKEEYMNLDTLDRRVNYVIRNASASNRTQQSPYFTSSSSTTVTMIPTPGLSPNGSLNSTSPSSVEKSVVGTSGYSNFAPNTCKTGNFLPNANGSTGGVDGVSCNTSDGALPNGFQRLPAHVSIGSGSNNALRSVLAQRAPSKMVPTPGLNNCQLSSNSPLSNNRGCLLGAEPPTVSQHEKHIISDQNNCMLPSYEDQVVGTRSTLHPDVSSYGYPIGVNGSAVSDNYLTAPSYGDGSAMNTAMLAVSGNLHYVLPSAGSKINSPDNNPVSMHILKSHCVGNQANPQAVQHKTHENSQMFDSASKLNLHGSNVSLQQPQKHNQQFQQPTLKSDTLWQSQQSTNQGSQVKSEHQMESSDMPAQVSGPLQLSDAQNQIRERNDAGDSSGIAQISCQLTAVDSQNNSSCGSARSETEVLLQDSRHFTSKDELHTWDQRVHEQHVQEELCQRVNGKDEAQRPYLSSDTSIIGFPTASRSTTVAPNISTAANGRGKATTEQKFSAARSWLQFLVHARRCAAPEGKCHEFQCMNVQKLLKHMKICTCTSVQQCPYPRCSETRKLIEHHRTCQSPHCQVCVPVRRNAQLQKGRAGPPSHNGSLNSESGSWKDLHARDVLECPPKTSQLTNRTSDDLQSLAKRIKVEHPSPSLIPKAGNPPASFPTTNVTLVSQDAQNQSVGMFLSVKTESEGMKTVPSLSCGPGSPIVNEIKKDEAVDNCGIKLHTEPDTPVQPIGLINQDDTKVEKGIDQAKPEIKPVLPSEQAAATKSGKPKIQGVSLTELFTPEQIKEHIISLRQWIGQSKAKAEKNQAMEHSMSENSCQLCAVERLAFEPPPLYCMPCGARIKRNTMYYTIGTGDTRYYFCIPCYNESRGDTIEVEGAAVPKARFEKRKNDEETDEWWVQCDKCEAWQHQICALFNGRRNDGGQAEYTCPNCYIGEVMNGDRKPLPQSSVLGAKDLPRTKLSDHLEERILRRLKQERLERARIQGKSFTEVPGAESLVVRVVSSVDKKLEVKPRFLEIFREDNYPSEYPYKSKVILLFQKIEGVEVCLFGMYVQEFGSDCELPNQRRVYLSYLDSVKYFRPEIKTVGGEALRTFVYHEILIGYLDYCKRRGFTSCYIWACPPLKGEDYILYCHPEIQKTPKSDKLREWYLSMLRKAVRENIVVDLTNLYDHFFVSTGECKEKVTAARLPYFDGDYWPGAAEDMLNQLLQEEDGRNQEKKGKTKKIMTKRALKAVSQTDLSGNASKDVLLMQKLGGTICSMKEDFIMVHLQHPCSHCRQLIISGIRWVCNQCKKFQLCSKCHDVEERLDERDRHPISSRDKHALHPVEVTDVPTDTKDPDEILESEFFDTRQAFLSLCQGNHYQYDTLRRAKHSSMMILYHLHNPTAPAFVTTCNACHNDIEAGQGWRCEICPEYDICNACFQKDGGVDHPHKLTNHPSMADRNAQNKEGRQKRVLQLRKMLDLLAHASQCRSASCLYPNCRKVKGLFRHGMACKTRASGGCGLCSKMWNILQLHARACKISNCSVPRCKDLKEHMRRLQQQSDSRRRAAVMEMMRQRAAEVAGNTSGSVCTY